MIRLPLVLFLSAALFSTGVYGVLARRNAVLVLMSIELMLNAVNINLVAFGAVLHDLTGQVFALFVITVASRSCGRRRATSRVVVPASSRITCPCRNRRLVARAIAAFSSLLTLARTIAPSVLASWTVASPTPPAAPVTSTISPGLSPPRSTSAKWAVR